MMPGLPLDARKHRRQLRRPSIVVSARGCSSRSTIDRRALRVRDRAPARSRRANRPAAIAASGAPLALERVGVGLLARDAVLAREHLRGLAHDDVRQRAREAVAIHRVDEREVAHLVAPARVLASMRYGIRLIDSMPPASDDVRLAEHDRLRAGGDRLHARRARLVDRLGRHAVGQPGAAPDLPRGVRARSGLTAVADEHFVDVRPSTPARSSAARAATAPSSAGWTFRNAPP